MEIEDKKLCYCCSDKKYSDCCEKFITNKELPTTAVELMRSRYTAFVLKDANYLVKTAAGKALRTIDLKATINYRFNNFAWTKLEILNVSPIATNSKKGIVEFKAYYISNAPGCLHEISKFEKINSKWFYTDGTQKEIIISKNNKIGRNERCVCGSGKKYKKCCGL